MTGDLPAKFERDGDVIIWDLRMAHHATPKRAGGPLPHGAGKLAVFFYRGADNPVTTEAYMNYVLSIPENDFLKRPRPAPVADTTREFVIR